MNAAWLVKSGGEWDESKHPRDETGRFAGNVSFKPEDVDVFEGHLEVMADGAGTAERRQRFAEARDVFRRTREIDKEIAREVLDDALKPELLKGRGYSRGVLSSLRRMRSQVKKYDPDEPRDERGRWTVGGGGGEPPANDRVGIGNTTIDENGKYHTDDVETAAWALANGHEVELNQPRQVSTLLDKLAKMADDAAARGEKAPNINLCNVSVAGTNLFCADAHGIERVKMPQLKQVPTPGSKADTLPKNSKGEADVTSQFVESLKSGGYKVESGTESAAYLRSTQNELVGTQVGGMVRAIREGKLSVDKEPLIVSRDNYIVDGHHRWAAAVGVDLLDNKLGDVSMPVLRVDAGIIELLARAKKFAGDWGLPQKAAKRAPWIVKNGSG